MTLNILLRWTCLVSLIALGGCAQSPNTSNCSNDDDCRERGEFCVEQRCVQCRDDSHCDTGQACTRGACLAIEGFCQRDSDCPAHLPRCADQRCDVACRADSDCDPDHACVDQRCLAHGCRSDADCGDGQTCSPAGQCVAAACQLAPVYFDFDEFRLREDAQRVVQANASCVQARWSDAIDATALMITGHCDERGTEEYNLTLGEQRARAVFTALRQWGLDPERLRMQSRGEYDPVVRHAQREQDHARNRRVEISPHAAQGHAPSHTIPISRRSLP